MISVTVLFLHTINRRKTINNRKTNGHYSFLRVFFFSMSFLNTSQELVNVRIGDFLFCWRRDTDFQTSWYLSPITFLQVFGKKVPKVFHISTSGNPLTQISAPKLMTIHFWLKPAWCLWSDGIISCLSHLGHPTTESRTVYLLVFWGLVWAVT